MGVKNLVVNFDEKGGFASATKQLQPVEQDVDGAMVAVPQPNESIELDELKKIVSGL